MKPKRVVPKKALSAQSTSPTLPPPRIENLVPKMSNTRANTKIFAIQSQIINWFIPAREKHYFVTISKFSIPTVLLLLPNNGHGPRVEDECHEEDGQGEPKVDGVWNLFIKII